MSRPIDTARAPEGAARRRATAGYTLAEVLVTTAVLGVLMAGVATFVLQNSRTLFTGEQKLLINADIRRFTNEMVENAREANYFVLYEGFYTRTRSDGVTVRRDANNSGAVNTADRRAAGLGGEFLVFVYYEDPYFDTRLYDGDPDNNEIGGGRVTRIVGYWVATNRDDSTKTALYVADSNAGRSSPSAESWVAPWGATFPASLDSSTTIESLLPSATLATAQASWARLIINDLTGQGVGGSYFVNYINRSVLVRAKILHGNEVKRVTNTYNFTVTPRG